MRSWLGSNEKGSAATSHSFLSLLGWLILSNGVPPHMPKMWPCGRLEATGELALIPKLHTGHRFPHRFRSKARNGYVLVGKLAWRSNQTMARG
jgi:hypothetical protein